MLPIWIGPFYVEISKMLWADHKAAVSKRTIEMILPDGPNVVIIRRLLSIR